MACPLVQRPAVHEAQGQGEEVSDPHRLPQVEPLGQLVVCRLKGNSKLPFEEAGGGIDQLA